MDTPKYDDTFSYDKASRIFRAVKDRYDIKLEYKYDGIGRKYDEKLFEGTRNYRVRHTYDAANRLINLNLPCFQSIIKNYTARNQLDTQYHGVNLISDHDYDDGMRETRREYGNGLVTTYTYGRSDNLATAIDVAGKTNLSTAYTYDDNKNVLTETRGGNMFGTGFTATFDDEDRVKTWTRDNGVQTQTWNLSTVGDWTDTTINGVLQSRTYTAAHEVDSIGGAALTYDANGNMTTDEAGNIYTWDTDNHLVQIQDSGLTVLAEYAYDAFGKRIRKTVSGTGKVFVHSGNQVVSEYEVTPGTCTRTRVYVYSGGYIDDPVMSMDSSNDWFYYHLNRQFNVYGMTDSTGIISELYSYDVYGK